MTAVQPATTQGFLFADLRDYTRYAETHGDDAAAALLTAYRRLVRDVVAHLGGAEIKTEGDSFYVVFSSASGAVQGGLAILAAAATANAQEPARPIQVGIGIHAGETAETGEGPVGTAVNIAARVCAEARAGELLVTDTVRSLTRTRLPVRFVARGARHLKGIAEPIALYKVEPTITATPLRPGSPFRGPVMRWLAPVAGLAAIVLVVVAAVLLRGGGTDGPSGSASSGSPAGAASVGPLALPELVDVPTYKGDDTRRGLQPGPALVTKPVVAWEQPLGAPADGTPIVVDGKVIIATDAGLSAWDARTGAMVWTFRGETGDLKFGGTTPSASAADRLVFAADTDGTFHAIDVASGIERWVFDKPVNATRSIVDTFDGIVYTGSDDTDSNDAYVYGLDVNTGDVRWTWLAPATVNDVTVQSGTAYVTVGDGRLYAIALADSRERWHAPQGPTTGARSGIPALEADTVYMGFQDEANVTREAILYAIDQASGKVEGRWVSPSGTQTSTDAERDGIVYVATRDDGLYALRLDGSDFKDVWRSPDVPTVLTGVAMVDDVLYVTGYDGRLLAYSASDGKELWEVPIADGTHNSGPVVTGGMVFQADEAGVLRAYVEPSLQALLPSPAPSLSPSQSSATPTTLPAASPPSLLEGIWTTAEITCYQQLAAISKAGFTDAQISESRWTCSQPGHYRLRFLADQFAQLSNQGDGPYERGSGRSFELLDDHTLFLTDGQQTLPFTLDGNVLTFLSVSGSIGDLDGQVHGAAIYLTAPFTKEP